MSKRDLEIEKIVSDLHSLNSMDPIIDFLKENHWIVEEYRKDHFSRLFHHSKEDESKKYIDLFIDCINAGGIGKLDDKSKSLEIFEKKYNSTYKNNPNFMINDLFENKYVQLKQKKSGLFIECLYYNNLINNSILDKNEKIVLPIDAVILRILTYILPKEHENALKKNDDGIKNSLTKYAKDKIGNRYSDYVKFDDLWFWGHITTQKNELAPKFNYTQVNLDPLLRYKKELLEKKAKTFIELINNVKKESNQKRKIAKM